jgi:two-component system response regulator DctR
MTKQPWDVLIVEDDPTVASIHCRLVSQESGFRVIGVATNAAQAQNIVKTAHPALVLLDLGLPGPSGIALLRWLRGAREPTEVIAVTATANASVVREVLHLGALDYLVKPFVPERMRRALAAFSRTMSLLEPTTIAQAAVDELRFGITVDGRIVPTELSAGRLDQIRDALVSAGQPLTSDEMAQRVGVARVTARRYLEHLAAAGHAVTATEPVGPGRPRKTYEAARATIGAPRQASAR